MLHCAIFSWAMGACCCTLLNLLGAGMSLRENGHQAVGRLTPGHLTMSSLGVTLSSDLCLCCLKSLYLLKRLGSRLAPVSAGVLCAGNVVLLLVLLPGYLLFLELLSETPSCSSCPQFSALPPLHPGFHSEISFGRPSEKSTSGQNAENS